MSKFKGNIMQPKDTTIASIVLAAGKGTRMKSATPKVLHHVNGGAILQRVLDTLNLAGIKEHCLILSPEVDGFLPFLKGKPGYKAVIQKIRLGTGDAVAAAAAIFKPHDIPTFSSSEIIAGDGITSEYVLITAADTPALCPKIIQSFVDQAIASGSSVGVIGMHQPDPYGYGRLVVNTQGLEKVVEEKDASDTERRITLCNTGVIFAKTEQLFSYLSRTTNQNAQSEFYLTDCFEVARHAGDSVFVFETEEYQRFAGVNSRSQLVEIEAWLQDQRKRDLLNSGVTINLPNTVYIDETCQIDTDIIIGANCCLLGNTTIGKSSIIGAGTVLNNAKIPQNSVISPGSNISKS